MNIKSIFGALLTALGIGGLIYATILFVNTSGGTHDIKALVIYSILGLLLFMPQLCKSSGACVCVSAYPAERGIISRIKEYDKLPLHKTITMWNGICCFETYNIAGLQM